MGKTYKTRFALKLFDKKGSKRYKQTSNGNDSFKREILICKSKWDSAATAHVAIPFLTKETQ